MYNSHNIHIQKQTNKNAAIDAMYYSLILKCQKDIKGCSHTCSVGYPKFLQPFSYFEFPTVATQSINLKNKS